MHPHRTVLTAAACVALLAFAATAAATGKVYKWTDAQGVTHYGDEPPARGEYETSRIPEEDRVARGDAGADAAAVATDAASPAGEDPQCAAVRRHLALLRGEAPVQQDTDGDGKADRILTQADRETQARLAEVMLARDCTSPAV